MNPTIDNRKFLVEVAKNAIAALPQRRFKLNISLEFNVADAMYKDFVTTPVELERLQIEAAGLEEYLNRITMASKFENVSYTLEDITNAVV